MRDSYISLNPNYSLKKYKDELIVFNYKTGRIFKVTPKLFSLLQRCDGKNKIEDMNFSKKTLNLLLKEKILLLSSKKKNIKVNVTSFSGSPLYQILWEVTGKCNLKCGHCYLAGQPSSENDLTYEEILHVINEMEKVGVLSVNITGGEPFLRKDICQIIRYLDHKKIRINGIFTNGTNLSKRVLEHISSIQKMPFYVSLDGFSNAHKKLRGRRIFRKTLDSIQILKDKGFPIIINTILYKHNKNEMLKFYGFIKKLGIARWRVTTPFYAGRWIQNSGEMGVTIKEELKIFKELIMEWVKDSMPFELELGSIFRSSMKEKGIETYTEKDITCNYYKNSCSIRPNGDVTWCGIYHPSFVVGNILNTSLSKIWMGKEMRKFKELKISDLLKISRNKKCRRCKYLKYCGLGCRFNALISDGSLFSLDTYFCKVIKMYFKEIWPILPPSLKECFS